MKISQILNLSFLKVTFKDSMRVWQVRLDLNRNCLRTPSSLSQEVKLGPKNLNLLVFFHTLKQNYQLLNGKNPHNKILMRQKSTFRQMVLKKPVKLARMLKRNNSILMRLKRFWLRYPRQSNSQLVLRSVICQEELTFHSYRINLLMKNKLDRI